MCIHNHRYTHTHTHTHVQYTCVYIGHELAQDDEGFRV
jgi:hypothetical protein